MTEKEILEALAQIREQCVYTEKCVRGAPDKALGSARNTATQIDDLARRVQRDRDRRGDEDGASGADHDAPLHILEEIVAGGGLAVISADDEGNHVVIRRDPDRPGRARSAHPSLSQAIVQSIDAPHEDPAEREKISGGGGA